MQRIKFFLPALTFILPMASVSILLGSTENIEASSDDYLIRLSSATMVVEFDRRSGALYSIKERNGRFGTNYLGNVDNYPGDDPLSSQWTGNIVTTVWELELPEKPVVLIPSFSFRPSGRWRSELTGRSQDIRKVDFDGNTLTVNYSGRSGNEGGIKSFDLMLVYHLAEDGSLLWDITIENTTGHRLEIGELALPFTVNDYYRGVRETNPYTNLADDHEVLYEDERLKLKEQPLIHEQKVACHHYVGGHSSYSLIQRPLGDPPFLLAHPSGDTAFECTYRMEGAGDGSRRRGRSRVLAIHSWAAKQRNRWSPPWVNGHTSLLLEPAEKKSFQMRFVFVDGYDAVRREMYKSGNLGVRILPSMVVPEKTPVFVELLSRDDPVPEFLSDNMAIEEIKKNGDKTLLTLSFKGRGQKSLRLHYGKGKWTNLHFYCVEDLERLIKARAQFITQRQFLDDPDDPFNRHHMFLPFDYRLGSTFKDSDNVWEVGGSDEYGFSEPLFLAEKNVYYPNREEIETLEAYVNDCLIEHIQNQETYALRASLYWKERYPSSPWGHWTEERSKESYRTYNYPHVANIYHALYRIGKRYGLTTQKNPIEYLRLAHRTCIKWFNTGPWKHVGVMCGSNAINILEDLKQEQMHKEYDGLLEEMQKCTQVFADTPYPYSSELFVDQTAHEHVYFFTAYFGHEEKSRKTLQVIQALRGGNQPVWFRYGNDLRGDNAGWYTEALNSMPLLRGFEETGNMDMLIKGYAGAMGVTANLLPDGMGFGRFLSTPGVFAYEPPKTLDNGIGMYGFFKAAKAYILEDASFGLIGCGCTVQSAGGRITASLHDGLKKRVLLVDEKIDIEAVKGEIGSLVRDRKANSLGLHMADSTGLVEDVEIIINGLNPGDYRLSHGTTSSLMTISDRVRLKVPVSEAGTIKIEQK